MADLIISGLISAKPLSSGVADTPQIQKIKQTAQDFEAVLLRHGFSKAKAALGCHVVGQLFIGQTQVGGIAATLAGFAENRIAHFPHHLTQQNSFEILRCLIDFLDLRSF